MGRICRVAMIHGLGRTIFTPFLNKCAAIYETWFSTQINISDPEDHKARRGNHRETGQGSARVESDGVSGDRSGAWI